METRPTPSARQTYLNRGALPFWAVHIAAIAGVIVVGFSWVGVVWATSLYVVRMFFVTAGYHRYFSHRSFKTSRPVQLILALGAQTSLQRGVLWWAAGHRHHHRYSDQSEDLHSAVRDGFWWAHVGWILSPSSDDIDRSSIRDLARYPELRALDRWMHTPGLALAVVLFLVGGPVALVWGFFVSTVLLWHGTFTINSLSHLYGNRRYATTDTSRNNPLLAAITLGEGWHNNHHYYQRSAAQGFLWWELAKGSLSYVPTDRFHSRLADKRPTSGGKARVSLSPKLARRQNRSVNTQATATGAIWISVGRSRVIPGIKPPGE